VVVGLTSTSFLRIGADGEVDSGATYSDDATTSLNSSVALPDGGFAAVGTYAAANGTTDLWVVRVGRQLSLDDSCPAWAAISPVSEDLVLEDIQTEVDQSDLSLTVGATECSQLPTSTASEVMCE
jgi:hypothetical protein